MSPWLAGQHRSGTSSPKYCTVLCLCLLSLVPLCVQVKLVGKQRLVLDLSCRQRDGQYYVVTDRWQRFSSLSLSAASLATLADSCDEFLVHGVDVEGMQLGIDDKLVELLGEWSPIPVTYAGGARTLVSESNGNRGRTQGTGAGSWGEGGGPGGDQRQGLNEGVKATSGAQRSCVVTSSCSVKF